MTSATERHHVGVGLAVGAAIAIGVLYGLVPQLPGLRGTLAELGNGDGSWLAAALAFELMSFAAYVAAFHAVFSDESTHLGWRASYGLTMAGVVATRLLAAASGSLSTQISWLSTKIAPSVASTLPGKRP